MKKTFLKATLFSLMLAAVPATMLTGCKDYDDDITNLNGKVDSLTPNFDNKLEAQEQALTNQINAINKQIADYNATAQKAAADAAEAAKAAAAAKAAGDEAMAAANEAKAEAAAATKAVAEARAEALEAVKTEIEALQSTIEGQIEDLNAKAGANAEQLAEVMKDIEELQANAVTQSDLDAAIEALKEELAGTGNPGAIEDLLDEYMAKVNQNTEDIAAIIGQIEGVDSKIVTLTDDLASLEQRVKALENGYTSLAAAVAVNTAAINDLVAGAGSGSGSGNPSTPTPDFTNLIAQVQANTTAIAVQQTALDNFQKSLADLQLNVNANADAIASINTKITALQAQLAALEAKIDGIDPSDDLSDMEEEIANISGEVKALAGQVMGINSNLVSLYTILDGRLTSVTREPDLYVGGIPSINFNTGEYVPMTLVPNLPTGWSGIYTYPTNWTFNPASWVQNKFTVNYATTGNTYVTYNLNPQTITEVDIVINKLNQDGGLQYNQVLAETRAPQNYVPDPANTPVVTIQRATVENGKLNLVVGKNVAKNVNIGSTAASTTTYRDSIFTVALEVPIAEQHLLTWTDEDGNVQTESPEEAIVYSEYERVCDTYFQPRIAAMNPVYVPAEYKTKGVGYTNAVSMTNNPYYYYRAYQNVTFENPTWTNDREEYGFASGNAVQIQVPYYGMEGVEALTNTWDLSNYITVAMNVWNGDQYLMTPDELELWTNGTIGFQYSITGTYEISANGTTYDCQDFAQILPANVNNGILTITQPNGTNGKPLPYYSRINKTPIVVVTMVDKTNNNAVIDQCAIKLKYILPGSEYDLNYGTNQLTCNTIYAPTITGMTGAQIFLQGVINNENWPFTTSINSVLTFFTEYNVANVWEEYYGADADNNVPDNWTVNNGYSDVVIWDPVTYPQGNQPTGYAGVTVGPNNPISWVITPAMIEAMNGKSLNLSRTIIFTSTVDTQLPAITVTLNYTITWPNTLPALGASLTEIWGNDGVMQVTPVAMPVGFAGTDQYGNTHTYYNTDIFSGRQTPYITGLNNWGCANWDIQVIGASTGFYAGGNPSQYVPTSTNDANWAYSVMNYRYNATTAWDVDNTAAQIWTDPTQNGLNPPYNGIVNGATPFVETAANVSNPAYENFFTILQNTPGINLVNNAAVMANIQANKAPGYSWVDLGWYVGLTGMRNYVEISSAFNNVNTRALGNSQSTRLEIIPPLRNIYWDSQLSYVQNAAQINVPLMNGLTVQDCFLNVFNMTKYISGTMDQTYLKNFSKTIDYQITNTDGSVETQTATITNMLNLYAWYGIDNISFDEGKIFLSTTPSTAGNMGLASALKYGNYDINLNSEGQLMLTMTYQGINLAQAIYIGVPVTIQTAWGTLNPIIYIYVQPNTGVAQK